MATSIDLRTEEMKVSLSEEFLAPYKDKMPDFGPLGWVTYKRTYARPVPGENRVEEWWETIRRVAEGNINLDPRIQNKTATASEIYALQIEAESLFDAFFWLKMPLPPGRGLWMSGTPFANRTGDGLNNCWFVATRPHPYQDHEASKVSYPFCFLFDQSMKGGGVGFSVEQSNIDRIPKVKSVVKLEIVSDPKKKETWEDLKSHANKIGFTLKPNWQRFDYQREIRINDSREGWGEGLRHVIDAHWELKDGGCLVVDMSEIRGKGEPIKGFGGVASGPTPLAELLYHVNQILNKRWSQNLTAVDCTDIYNLIGRCVVAGNVRRTAEVALGQPTDQDFINMKNYKLVEALGYYDDEWRYHPKTDDELFNEGYSVDQIEELRHMQWAQMNHRWASNNSIIVDTPDFYDQPEFGYIHPAIQVNGEPGIFNRYLARNFGRIVDGYKENCDAEVEGANPCVEIALGSGEPCNLFEFFPLNADKHGYDYAEGLRLGTRYAKRVTFSKYSWKQSRDIVNKNRRLGLSLSGIQDWIDHRFDGKAIIGWEEIPRNDRLGVERWPIYNPELVTELDRMYQIVKESDREYSTELGCNESIKLTAVKPSGTVSLVAGGLSPGVHYHYFSYGIRRIRFEKGSPLLPLLDYCGFYMEDAVQSPNSVVVEFPFRAPAADNKNFRSCEDITIEEQFAMQALLQTYWADNMVSCTITFKEDEKEKIPHLLRQYRNHIKATSLLPYSGHGYAQAPYEPFFDDKDENGKVVKTAKEKYEERMDQIRFLPHEVIQEEGKWEEIMGPMNDVDDSAECEGGHCPIR